MYKNLTHLKCVVYLCLVLISTLFCGLFLVIRNDVSPNGDHPGEYICAKTFSFQIQPFEFDEDLEDHVPFVSGCFKNKIWESIDASRMVLRIIRRGYFLPLTEDHLCVNFKNHLSAIDNQDFVAFIKSGILVQSPTTGYSHLLPPWGCPEKEWKASFDICLFGNSNRRTCWLCPKLLPKGTGS